MHNPTNPGPRVLRYSDSLIEMDVDIGRIADELRSDPVPLLKDDLERLQGR